MKALGKDDPELTALVLRSCARRASASTRACGSRASKRRSAAASASGRHDGGTHDVEGTHLLVATGRKPNVDGLNLDAAGIKFDRRGIKVNGGLVTSNSRVFAIGDVIGGLQFTHVANYHAGIVIRRALFRLPAKVNRDIIPWVTFTDPEIAHIGLNEEASEETARPRQRAALALPRKRPGAGRARDGRARQGRYQPGTAGFSARQSPARMPANSSRCGRSPSRRAYPSRRWRVSISPYPTLSEINKRAATSHYVAKLANPWLRMAVQWLGRFG